ncbi:MAG: HNH endonuclease [Acidimicrobiaceae bacterium]|nr:HNH endonuclease [Acidimicrobiaceae bacterium]
MPTRIYNRGVPLLDRWAAHVIAEPSGCWGWLGAHTPYGYGHLNVGGSRYDSAYRVGYRLLIGEVPEGLELDHLCRNPGCVNPTHLEPVTHRVNVFRGSNRRIQAAISGTCIRGHGPDNFAYRPDGRYHYCRACRRLYRKDRRR